MNDAEAIIGRLEACFREIHARRMEGIPILNEALEVRVVGTVSWRGYWLCVLITPWSMNIVLLPHVVASEIAAIGEKRLFGFPAGPFEFILGEEAALGPFWMCSLFSPVFEFADMDSAVAAAEAALAELLNGEEEEAGLDRDMQRIWQGELPETAAKVATVDQAEDKDVEALVAVGHEDLSGVVLSRRRLLTGRVGETN